MGRVPDGRGLFWTYFLIQIICAIGSRQGKFLKLLRVEIENYPIILMRQYNEWRGLTSIQQCNHKI